MKNFYLFFVVLLAVSTQAQTITFGDVRLKNKLLYADVTNATAKDVNGNQIKIDSNNNNEIEIAEAQQVYALDLNVVQTILATTYNSIAGLENFVNLRKLVMHFYYNPSISFAAFPQLEELTFTGSTQTTSISLAGIPNLKRLNISGNTNVPSIDLSPVPLLEYFTCSYVYLTTLNVSMLTQLRELICNNNQLTSLNLTGLTLLTKLVCNVNYLTSLNLSGNPWLTYVNCSEHVNLTSLNITGLSQLTYLDCSYLGLTTLNLSGNTPMLQYLYAQGNEFTALNVSGLQNLLELNCSQTQFNELLVSLNLTGCTNLKKLTASFTKLATLNLTPFVNLTDLEIEWVPTLTSLNISGLSQLQKLFVERTTGLTTFTYTDLPALTYVNFEYSALQRLDLENSPLLTNVYGNYSAVKFVNVSNAAGLYALEVNSCPNLVSLLVKNGRTLFSSSYAFNSPSLRYLCVDENRFTEYQQRLTSYSNTLCQINSYCSFHPGGVYYDITGTNRIDTGSDGCAVSDPAYSSLKLKITNGTTTGYIIAKADGSYTIPVQTGSHVITPVPENTNYYNVSPASATVNFSTAVNPYNLSFCFTPNGVKNDVQVMIMPVSAARPGFNATYKLIYKNKGNQLANGTVSLSFPDSSVDFISALPAPSSQSGATLNWNYTNLIPMESREVLLTFNLNTPMETPPVNNGDVLNYEASISTPITDLDLYNNTFNLNQTVVGSFDPNDKTCLEGASVNQTVIGQYVHYLIRFENTGTYPAENIVVSDVINATMFDINSLQPISGSHSYVTRISGSKVEFIFENINLPFANATNDGYIMFKIKTKSSLGVGSTFSNQANIYFDYNFPIVTNTASSEIVFLNTDDFTFADRFTLYPNPANDVLHIEGKSGAVLTSVEVYAIDGKLVMAVPQNVELLDVSSLSAGTYVIKVNSEKGSAGVQFVKN